MARNVTVSTTLLLLLALTSAGFAAIAETVEEKPSLAESNPLVIPVVIIGGLVGVVISALALRALWRARQYDEEQ